MVIAKHFVVEITAKARRVLKPNFDYAPIERGAAFAFYKGVDEVLLVPLYPQYAMSSFETVVVKVLKTKGRFFQA